MKHTKRILSVLLAVLLIAVSVPYAFAASFNYTSKNIYYGKALTLQVKGGTASAWTSSNTAVATVSSKGVVKGVGIGTAVINAKVGRQTLSCKVKVKDRNVDAAVTFRTSTGGAFIYKVNTAVIKIRPQTYNVGKATVYVVDAAGKGYYKTTLTKLAKDKTVALSWDGRDMKGKVVPNGSYNVLVKIGAASSTSNMLSFVKKNAFAGGDGSKKNPFQVATANQLKQIIRYPNAYYKQTKNIDCGYEAIGGFFTEDQPFNGVYDGNQKVISKIFSNKALFEFIGQKGTLKNLKMKDCNITIDENNTDDDLYAILVTENRGKIANCNIDGIVTVNNNQLINAAIICDANFGTISNCVSAGTVNCEGKHHEGWATNAIAGGIVCGNYGKIISSVSNVNVSSTSEGAACAGGVAGINRGLISNCEATGEVFALSKNYGKPSYFGGIAGVNESQIIKSVYTGQSDIPVASQNTGVIA